MNKYLIVTFSYWMNDGVFKTRTIEALDENHAEEKSAYIEKIESDTFKKVKSHVIPLDNHAISIEKDVKLTIMERITGKAKIKCSAIKINNKAFKAIE